jgi:zinc and cadmium transporter
MSEHAWLAVYCLLVLLGSTLGGFVPFLGRVSHSRLQLYLSLSAGVMLGASFFHVMPEAMTMCGSGASFGWWMSLGVVGLFCIERFIAPHSHEVDGGSHHEHAHDHKGHEHAGHEHTHDHAHPAEQHAASSVPKDQRAAAPAVAGWMAVLGLTIHTFMNGVGLAGAVQVDADLHAKLGAAAPPATSFLMSLPGIAMFLAIVLHKPADAMAISMVLSRKGVSRGKILLVQLGFAAMVSVGVVAFQLTRGAIAEDMEGQLTGAALAFSAGTFLFIALSDLLPEVQFHRHDRFLLFLALTLGVAGMGGIALLEGEGHNHGGHEHGVHEKADDQDDDKEEGHHHHGHKH